MMENKQDSGKLRYDLMPVEALEEITHVYNFGVLKYGERTWEQGIKVSKLYAACLRHLFAWWRGEDLDQESCLSHLAHAAWNLVAILAYYKWGRTELDDRPLKSKEGPWNPK